jgi:alanine dehydrogenase
MRIGVPKEIKNREARVALTPAGADALVKAGHAVQIEQGAGIGCGFPDEAYQKAGAAIVKSAADVWSGAEMILKVKEPLPEEYGYFREGLILFAFLHLAAQPDLAKALLRRKVTSFAYETVEAGGRLPLLLPMSEVAGRMAVQVGARLLEKPQGGSGLLLSGVPGVRRGKVAIIGAGTVGTHAAKIAVGLGAGVTLIDVNPDRLRQLDDLFGRSVQTLLSTPAHIAEAVADADLAIGAVLLPGARAPKLVTEAAVRAMRPGSVVVDVAVDQGGIFETVDRVTTHDCPTYLRYGVVHYAVPNMPGAVPQTSTLALAHAVLPYAMHLAAKGAAEAIRTSEPLRRGLNTAKGAVTHPAIARELGLPCSQLGTA